MLKSYYWALYLAMISAGSYFLADMTSLAIGSHLDELLDASSQPLGTSSPPSEIQKQSDSRVDYRALVNRNIFDSRKPDPVSAAELAIDVSAGNRPESPAPTSLPPLNLTLVGTVVAKGRAPLAVIRDPKKKGQTIYRKGDSVAGSARISEITRKKVVLFRGGRREVLELTADPKKNVGRGRPGARRLSAPPLRKPNNEETIRKVSENQWILDRRELDNAMKNLPQLLTKARLLPNFKEGKPDGFRIFAIARNSLYAKIGLQNGDILHRINGVDVKNPQNFMKVMEQLKDENSVSINLVRRNQQQTFNYEIR